MPTASSKLDEFFNVLRDTGTELPLCNSDIVDVLVGALEAYGPAKFDEPTSTTIDNLLADLEVVGESIRYREEHGE